MSAESAAERLARIQAAYVPPEPKKTNGKHAEPERFAFTPECYLPDAWWEIETAGPLGKILRHIRQAALAEGKCATALLTLVLCRVGAALPHTIRLDSAGMGAPSPLSLFAFIVGPPGSNKSTTMALARRYTQGSLPLLLAGETDSMPVGSGEGFVDVLFDMVDTPIGDGSKTKPVKMQVHGNAYFTLDEGSQLQALATGRSGSTLFQNLCSVWSGGDAGNKNVGKENTRYLPAGSYTYGLVIGVQPAKVAAVVNDKDGGTPQRFLWTPAPRGFRLDERPAWPGTFPWTPPLPQDLRSIAVLHTTATESTEHYYLTQDQAITDEMHEQDNAVNAQEILLDDFDVHRMLMKRRVAGLFTLLDGEVHIPPVLWEHAEGLMATSDATRALVLNETRAEADRTFEGKKRFQSSIAVAQDEAVSLRRTVTCATKIAERVHAEPERWLYSTMRRTVTARDREVMADAIEHAIAEQWIKVVEEAGQGKPKRALRPGKKKP
jgi:hypothetical protein